MIKSVLVNQQICSKTAYRTGLRFYQTILFSHRSTSILLAKQDLNTSLTRSIKFHAIPHRPYRKSVPLTRR